MFTSLLASFRRFSFLLVVYTMSTSDLQQLSDKMDARLALISKLKSGLDNSTALLDKLSASNADLDKKINSLLQTATDTTALDTVTQSVTDKNQQLQGLVDKIGIALK